MLGGYQILDLRNIGITLGNSQVSITDAEILSQLRNLRNYIEKGHDYGKALNNSPKPVLIRYRDAKNSEKLEVSAFASVTSSNNSLTYDIRAKGLQIEVVFEEKTDDDGNKYYDIKTAKYLYSENESVEGDMSIGGDLSVTGDISGGKISGNEIIENMTGYSASVHPDIAEWTKSIVYVGATKTGNKLTLVACIKLTIPTGNTVMQPTLIKFVVPADIASKLYPVSISGYSYLDQKAIPCFTDANTYRLQPMRLSKAVNELNLILNVTSMTEEVEYLLRYECTFLLNDSLIQ